MYGRSSCRSLHFAVHGALAGGRRAVVVGLALAENLVLPLAVHREGADLLDAAVRSQECLNLGQLGYLLPDAGELGEEGDLLAEDALVVLDHFVDDKIRNGQVAQVETAGRPGLGLVLDQLAADNFVPAAVHFLHQFLGVVLVLDHHRQQALNQVLAPEEPVHHELVLGGFAQDGGVARLPGHVLGHGVGLGDDQGAVGQKGQLHEVPVGRELLLVVLPAVGVEEDVLVGHLQILAGHARDVGGAPVGIRPDDYLTLLIEHYTGCNKTNIPDTTLQFLALLYQQQHFQYISPVRSLWSMISSKAETASAAPYSGTNHRPEPKQKETAIFVVGELVRRRRWEPADFKGAELGAGQ